ncbi:MAG: XRE family transcriptional regulator [Bacteroidota bacterium]|nr:XRE family transcriptional regulator [Bacteroidota bacterium]
MITNERQYRITRKQADRFRRAIEDFLSSQYIRSDIQPRLIEAELEAMKSQLADLTAELKEYERLKSESPSLLRINSFDELAEGLIKARIASGLSQKSLAGRMGIKEQQVQRYESTRYASASYERLREVTDALRLHIRNDIFLHVESGNFQDLLRKLRDAGLKKEFVLNRLLTSEDAARASGEVTTQDENIALAARTAVILNRIFGWTNDTIFGSGGLEAPQFAAAAARFRMPPRRKKKTTDLYAAYANYLAVLALEGSKTLPRKSVPNDAEALRRCVLEKYGSINLRHCLHTAWNLGVAVLPLRDSGGFHGACWRYDGRNVIVLKQTSSFESRWQFDLLHELYHAGQKPEDDTLEVIETDKTMAQHRNSAEEWAANEFAADVALNGKAKALLQECVRAAEGSIEKLKKSVPEVAVRNEVDVGFLANYMAFRLSAQGENWWGTAANLQSADRDPWGIARDVFIQRFPYNINNKLDRQLLDRALN